MFQQHGISLVLKNIIPDEISKFIFTNETYMKKATQESEEARKERAEF